MPTSKTSFSPSVKIYLLSVPRRCFFCGSFCFFMIRVCHAFLSVHSRLVVNCWKRAKLLALLYKIFCVFVTFPCDVLGQVWCLIASIPDLCLLTNFLMNMQIWYACIWMALTYVNSILVMQLMCQFYNIQIIVHLVLSP